MSLSNKTFNIQRRLCQRKKYCFSSGVLTGCVSFSSAQFRLFSSSLINLYRLYTLGDYSVGCAYVYVNIIKTSEIAPAPLFIELSRDFFLSNPISVWSEKKENTRGKKVLDRLQDWELFEVIENGDSLKTGISLNETSLSAVCGFKSGFPYFFLLFSLRSAVGNSYPYFSTQQLVLSREKSDDCSVLLFST